MQKMPIKYFLYHNLLFAIIFWSFLTLLLIDNRLKYQGFFDQYGFIDAFIAALLSSAPFALWMSNKAVQTKQVSMNIPNLLQKDGNEMLREISDYITYTPHRFKASGKILAPDSIVFDYDGEIQLTVRLEIKDHRFLITGDSLGVYHTERLLKQYTIQKLSKKIA